MRHKIAETTPQNSKLESCTTLLIAKRLWHIVRVAYNMLRKGVPKSKLIMLDHHLLFKRGKLAGKAFSHFITFHYHHNVIANSDRYFSAFSCRSLDTSTLFYDPKGVEFSCSNTPSYGYYSHTSTKRKSHRESHEKYATMASKSLEISNSEFSDVESVMASSPMLGFAEKSPTARQLRITDSPFSIQDHEVADEEKINMKAEEFIKRFYEQLGNQQFAGAARSRWA